jgi:superfamily I DNA/RNA helicase
MPSDEARALAASRRGIVIAPAGCGKTYLLAEAVSYSPGRQLVLTHTHAGVRAIRAHLERQGVPTSKYRVVTIDGFALRYASAFPTLSQWTITEPSGDDWKTLRLATHRLLQTTAIRRVISLTYAGVFIDEYQDCSIAQHQLILNLAEVIPVRAVGDPLQSIFAFLDRSEYCRWKDVESNFTLVAELNTPHRWNTCNNALGSWLSDVRRLLITGQAIDLNSSPVIWKHLTNEKEKTRLNACYGVKVQAGHSMVALRKWRPECNRLARNLKGRFRVMETVECDELLEWAQRFEETSGVLRVKTILEFAELCMSGLPPAIKQIGDRLNQGNPPKPQRDDYKKVLHALEDVRDKNNLRVVLDAMSAITDLDHKLVLARHELWREMKKVLQLYQNNSSVTLRRTACNLRNQLRHVGSKVDRASLATPLLVKGLEFDHALILDADDHKEAESLYVAMTRGSRSLTIVSENPVLTRPKPRYVLDRNDTSFIVS